MSHRLIKIRSPDTAAGPYACLRLALTPRPRRPSPSIIVPYVTSFLAAEIGSDFDDEIKVTLKGTDENRPVFLIFTGTDSRRCQSDMRKKFHCTIHPLRDRR